MESGLTGKRVKLIRMEDPYTTLKPGDEGTIRGVDGIGQIMVNWDSGSTLSLVPDFDEYYVPEIDGDDFEDEFEDQSESLNHLRRFRDFK